MALSKHTAAGTQGKGDRSSWGSTGRDREGVEGGHEMSSCNLKPLFLHRATISSFNNYRTLETVFFFFLIVDRLSQTKFT